MRLVNAPAPGARLEIWGVFGHFVQATR
jgi:hypothetical protein